MRSVSGEAGNEFGQEEEQPVHGAAGEWQWILQLMGFAARTGKQPQIIHRPTCYAVKKSGPSE